MALHNDLSMAIVILCYFLLCISYAIRGELNIFGYKISFAHHFMQFVVSTIYFTIGYTYLTDSKYNEQTSDHYLTNSNFIKLVIGYLLIVAILTVFYIMFKKNNPLIV